jgi:transglutaminase-like putative cysteine protease
MKTPVLLLGASLMFWGWQSDQWVWAVLMAGILEGSRLIHYRWDLSEADFRRISDLCLILFLILLVYYLMADRTVTLIVGLIQWLPVVFMPLVIAQEYSTSDRIDIRALFLLLRRKPKIGHPKSLRINLTYPYFAVCILAASAANVRGNSFYPALFVLCGLALWTMRSKRFSPLWWIFLMVLAGGLGLTGHTGLHRLQLVLEEKGLEWASDFSRHDSDPSKTHTAIGDIGSLKPSGRIVFRVKPDGQQKLKMLLRESAYDRFLAPLWVAVDPRFTAVPSDSNSTSWRLKKGPTTPRAITVSTYHHQGQGLLKLPAGAFRINSQAAVSMERNRFGTVKVEGDTEFVAYQVAYDEGVAGEDPPGEYDLKLPSKEKAVLNDIIARLKLSGEPPRKILKEIQSFFRSNFQYSLEQTGPKNKNSALSHFLMHSRSGHCEYFASATVLLLRAAGLPARYARGYSLHEFSKLERQYLVRDRHAHAWALVYLDGAWHDVDTTPGSWIDTENTAASGWQSISDLWSWCRFNLSQALRWVKQHTGLTHWLWIALPLVIFPAGRHFFRKRLLRVGCKKVAEIGPVQTAAGLESGFYLIEQALVRAGFARRSSESMANWIAKLPQNQFAAPLAENLKSLVDLHYRFRFDPRGISDAEKSHLISAARAWLNDYHKAQSGL